MKKIAALCLLLAPLQLPAQQYSAYAIPDSLLDGALEVVRSDSYELEVRSEKEGVIRRHRVVTLLSRESDANIVVLGYDADSKVRKLEARIYDASGQEVRKLGKNEVQDFAAVDGFSIYQDNRVKALEANHHEYPYTVSYEYEMAVSGINFAFFPFWRVQEYEQSIGEARFVIRLPGELPLHYKALNIDLEPQLSETEKETVYSWEVKGLKAMQREPYSPPSSEVLPGLLTAAGKFQVEEYEGSMSSWQDFGTFMGQLFEGRDALPEDVAAEARQLAAKAASDREKLGILYRYLQDNMRYVSVQLGIGGWQPFDARYVAENKYGDCKALSNFMKALLKEVDIEAYPVLITNGRMAYEVEESFTYPLFNHAILYVPSEDMWLECTSGTYPPGYIGNGNSGRKVLLVTPEGGRLKSTPELTEEDNTAFGKTDITLNPDGTAAVEGVIYTTGSKHEVYRWCRSNYSREELEKWFVGNSSLPTMALQSLEIEAGPDAPEARCRYRATLPRYGSKAGKRLFIPLNSINPFESVPEKLEERHFPIVADKAYTETDTVFFTLPEGFQVESMPEEPVVVESSFGAYKAWVEKKGRQLAYFRRFQLRKGRLPAEAYESFRSFYQQVAKADKAMVVLIE
ncbi:MAG: DUF3857 and transglutaminase domain-containing protein, partial [Phaeodactylibacter sp.]|nr:DUF3857 and transglutaminase domain-containing protein [Phaeodactylibacter sp.]